MVASRDRLGGRRKGNVVKVIEVRPSQTRYLRTLLEKNIQPEECYGAEDLRDPWKDEEALGVQEWRPQSSAEYEGVGPTGKRLVGLAALFLETGGRGLLIPKMASRLQIIFPGANLLRRG